MEGFHKNRLKQLPYQILKLLIPSSEEDTDLSSLFLSRFTLEIWVSAQNAKIQDCYDAYFENLLFVRTKLNWLLGPKHRFDESVVEDDEQAPLENVATDLRHKHVSNLLFPSVINSRKYLTPLLLTDSVLSIIFLPKLTVIASLVI